jgi:hypothetical protein
MKLKYESAEKRFLKLCRTCIEEMHAGHRSSDVHGMRSQDSFSTKFQQNQNMRPDGCSAFYWTMPFALNYGGGKT